MRFYTFILTHLLLLGVTACAAAQPLQPQLAQAIIADTWHTDQHMVWELDWPAAPVGGPVTVETWRVGDQYRYEILESAAPALIGETLIYNEHTAWQSNRFDSALLVILDSPQLSPVSDAFAVIEQLIITSPQSAAQESVQSVHGPAQKITLTYPSGDSLSLWRDDETQLPVKIVFVVSSQKVILNARNFEPLLDPPQGLFTIP